VNCFFEFYEEKLFNNHQACLALKPDGELQVSGDLAGAKEYRV
jgi:hypothetical protein